jgi:hypothetical protein
MRAFAKYSYEPGQFYPAIDWGEGKFITYTPTSYSEERALEIAQEILENTIKCLDAMPKINEDE